ncbi:MAG: hypothetical protein JWO68_4301, partial [Actinomycetia bacterium]|nr:hypothetical protein [Actinomycetes bacterium]
THPFRSTMFDGRESPRMRLIKRVAAATTGGLMLTLGLTVPALASPIPTAVDLGSAASFSLLAGAAATIPASTLPGEVGAVTAITDDSNTVYGSPKHTPNDGATQQALADASSAFTTLNGLAATGVLAGTDLGGQTLTPGVYHSAAALAATSAVTFDALGDPNAYFIVRGDAGLGTAASTSMNLIGGAQTSHIFWVLGGAATLGASSTFDGTVLSAAAISAGASVHYNGRAISLTAAVTLDADIFGPLLGAAPAISITGGPTATTGDTTPTITGTTNAPVGTAVSVMIGTTTLTTTVLTGGIWSVTVGTPLPEGTITVTASTTPTGAATGTATQALTIDTTAPTISIAGGTTASTGDSTPTISGSTNAPTGTTVHVSVGGHQLTTSVIAGGTWSLTSPALADGVVAVIASVSDDVGNVGSATQSLRIDSTAPSLTIKGGPKATTKDWTPTISGTTDAPVGSVVTVAVAGQSLSAIVISGGKWSVTAAGLANGAAHVIANVSDADGNTATATQVLTVRRPAPVVHHLRQLVYFAGDSAAITNSTRAKILALAHRVPSNALTITVHITGYIKLIGPTTENKVLATARTRSVYLLMKDKVVATYTLRGVAKGLSYHVNARRVQVTISYTLADRS